MTMATMFFNGGRRLVLGALLALSTGTTLLAQEPIAKLDGRLRLELARESAKPAPGLARTSASMRDVFLTGDPDQIRQLVVRHGGVVRTIAGGIVTARVPSSALLEIAASASVRRVQGATPLRPFNDAASQSIEADRVWTAPPQGQSSYTGKGVIVGIIDSGIDWTHPDFRDPDDTTKTRILRIWDQSDSLGSGVEGFDYGTEWTSAQIEAALASGDYSSVRHRDQIGHGTHVAGTAAGNAIAIGRHRGMAYDADIAVVSLDWQSSTSLVDAAKYLFELGRELGRPVVINMSLGSVDAPRDGSDAVDIALDNLVRESAGRVVCVAAGNLGETNDHWAPALSSEPAWTYVMHDPMMWDPDPSDGLSIVLRMVVPNSAVASTRIAIGVDSLGFDDTERVTPVETDRSAFRSVAEIAAQGAPEPLALTYRDGSPAGNVMMVATPEGEEFTSVYMIITDLVDEGYTGADPMRNGVDFFRVLLEGEERAHVWTSMGLAVDTSSIAVPVEEGYASWDNGYSVTSPGTARTALTVGAYANVAEFEDFSGQTVAYPDAGVPGTLASFSSVGPTFDGRQKPEIAAPGHGVISALAFNLRDAFLEMEQSPVASGGRHAIFSGTSMACPVTTGAVALYLEKNPTASYDQVKEAITSTARRDQQTSSFGSLPNAHWGHGKLDIYNAIYGATSGVGEDEEASGIVLASVAPNPAMSEATLRFSLETRQEVLVDIVDLQGVVRATLLTGTIDAGRHEAHLDATTLEPGVYTVRLAAGGTTRCRQLSVVR